MIGHRESFCGYPILSVVVRSLGGSYFLYLTAKGFKESD